jgi:hypothetical protein
MSSINSDSSESFDIKFLSIRSEALPVYNKITKTIGAIQSLIESNNDLFTAPLVITLTECLNYQDEFRRISEKGANGLTIREAENLLEYNARSRNDDIADFRDKFGGELKHRTDVIKRDAMFLRISLESRLSEDKKKPLIERTCDQFLALIEPIGEIAAGNLKNLHPNIIEHILNFGDIQITIGNSPTKYTPVKDFAETHKYTLIDYMHSYDRRHKDTKPIHPRINYSPNGIYK